MTKELVSFEVWNWSEWVEDIVNRLKGELKYNVNGDPIAEITVDDLLYAPPLDPENPQPFCERFIFSKCYEDRIIVKHYDKKDCYWFINGEDTCLMYKPKVKSINLV